MRFPRIFCIYKKYFPPLFFESRNRKLWLFFLFGSTVISDNPNKVKKNNTWGFFSGRKRVSAARVWFPLCVTWALTSHRRIILRVLKLSKERPKGCPIDQLEIIDNQWINYCRKNAKMDYIWLKLINYIHVTRKFDFLTVNVHYRMMAMRRALLRMKRSKKEKKARPRKAPEPAKTPRPKSKRPWRTSTCQRCPKSTNQLF